MRWWATAPTSLLLIVIILSPVQAEADDQSWGPDEVLVHLKVRFDTLHSGELELFIGNTSETSLVLDGDVAPPIYQGRGSNLFRLHAALFPVNSSWSSIFRSILDPGDGLNVSSLDLRYSPNGTRFFMLLSSYFNVSGSENAPEYTLLDFLRGIRPRELDPDDPYSAIDRDRDIDRLSKIRVRVGIEPPRRANMDLQFDGTAHRRGFPSESFDRTMTLLDFNEMGNKMTMSDSPLFSPLAMLLFCGVTVLCASVLLLVAWARKRFVRWALVFPVVAIAACLFTAWTYVRPYLNIYGTFEGGMIASSLFMLSAVIALQFAPDGRKRVEEGPSVEDEAEEDLTDVEMPKVVYVDRHVFVKVDSGRRNRGEVGEDDPYRVLGVRRDDDPAVVEKAFRKKVLQYHPDKFEKGPDWVREKAKEETMRLNRAYEDIKRDQSQ